MSDIQAINVLRLLLRELMRGGIFRDRNDIREFIFETVRQETQTPNNSPIPTHDTINNVVNALGEFGPRPENFRNLVLDEIRLLNSNFISLDLRFIGNIMRERIVLRDTINNQEHNFQDIENLFNPNTFNLNRNNFIDVTDMSFHGQLRRLFRSDVHRSDGFESWWVEYINLRDSIEFLVNRGEGQYAWMAIGPWFEIPPRIRQLLFNE